MTITVELEQDSFDAVHSDADCVRTQLRQTGAEQSKTRRHAAAPTEGMSLEMRTARRGKPVRDAVEALVQSAVGGPDQDVFRQLFSPRWTRVDCCPVGRRLTGRLAWNLVGIALLADAVSASSQRISLAEAEEWFREGVDVSAARICGLFSPEGLWRAEQLLRTVVKDDEFWELLPHIFEEHGQGSRASVLRDPSTASARSVKRRDGVFYTPSDVADYMVSEALDGAAEIVDVRALDPACGTGVFLLALLRRARSVHGPSFDPFEYAGRCLYGMDTSGQALDACAFVLLRESWLHVERRELGAWAAWHRLRLNLLQIDALTVTAPKRDIGASATFQRVRNALDHGAYVGASVETDGASDTLFSLATTAVPVNAVFPTIVDGFDCVIGNPPYATISSEANVDALASEFRSLPASRVSGRGNLFPLFIELLWKLARADNSTAALVTPLSIAYHTGTQFENCRRAMSAAGGRWRFAFFDREPHALFGEEVKTRNAILFHSHSPLLPCRGELAEIATGPLRKWTSRTRSHLFESIDFTPLGALPITFGIPKLRGDLQASAFRVLQKRHDRLPRLCARIGKMRPADTLMPSSIARVFVGGTAYNFLNVYRSPELPVTERVMPMSESPVHCLEFASDTDAEVGMAVLSSRLVFWLWHVIGDGFHVSARLFDAVPFSRRSFSAEDFDELATLGRKLWAQLSVHRFTSFNGGRMTIGYRSLACGVELDAIDALLSRTAALSPEFVTHLRLFVRSNAVVDDADESRAHVSNHFIL